MSIVSFFGFKVVRLVYLFIYFLVWQNVDETFFNLSSCRLEGTEEKFRNRESRHEDLQLIAELKDMVSERESLVKKLVVGSWWLSNTI